MVYNIDGEPIQPYEINGHPCSVYDISGNLLAGDYDVASSKYEQKILSARNAWMSEARADSTIIPMVIHADQHGRLTANNSLFSYLSKAVPWADISACIGLGDTCDYNEASFQNMESCLSSIPKEKQINIWGNHDTWTSNWYQNIEVPTAEEQASLNQYFDNSNYNGNHKYNEYGIEYMIDEERKIKYVVIGGWEYDVTLGGHSHYVISSDGMEDITQMLSAQDEYDIVILSHIQPFQDRTTSEWTHPPVEDGENQGGGGGMSVQVGHIADVSITQMLLDRQNRASGTVQDSYGNSHAYDFSGCTSELICCFSGHEHCDKYTWRNGNIPVYLFDAYAYDNHPIYFVNVDRTNRRMNIWKIDDSPMVYNYQIPFDQPTE